MRDLFYKSVLCKDKVVCDRATIAFPQSYGFSRSALPVENTSCLETRNSRSRRIIESPPILNSYQILAMTDIIIWNFKVQPAHTGGIELQIILVYIH